MTKVWEFYNDDPKKWMKEKYQKENMAGEVIRACLLGAIAYCYPDRQDFETVKNKIRSAIRKECGMFVEDWVSIAGWNDSGTFEKVNKMAKELDI